RRSSTISLDALRWRAREALIAQFEAGLPPISPHRPKKVFDRHRVIDLRKQGLSIRQIAKTLRLGVGTVSRTLQSCSKSTPAEKGGPPLIMPALEDGKSNP